MRTRARPRGGHRCTTTPLPPFRPTTSSPSPAASGPCWLATPWSTPPTPATCGSGPRFPQYYVPLGDVRADAPGGRRHLGGDAPGGREAGRVADRGRPPARGGPDPHRRQGGRPRRHGPLRMVGARCLVRGGRAGLRPPAQPLHEGRRHPVHPHGPGGVLRRRPRRVLVAGHVLRDRPAHALLPEPHGHRLHPPRPLARR